MKKLLHGFFLLGTAVSLSANIYPNPGYETWNRELNGPSASPWHFNLKEIRKIFKTFEQDGKVFHSGKFSLHVKDENPGPVNNSIRFMLGTGDSRRLAGQTLYFSVWVKQVKCSSKNGVGISIWYKTKAGKIGDKCVNMGTAEPTDWKKLSTSLLLPKDTTLIFINIHCAGGFGATAEAYFDDVMLTTDPDEFAGKPPKVKPAPKKAAKAKVPAPRPAVPLWKGHKYFVLHPLPFSWKYHQWGGSSFETNPATVDFIHLKMPKGVSKYGGFTIGTDYANRRIDLSKVPADQLKLSFRMTRDIAVHVAFVDRAQRTRQIYTRGTKQSDGTYLYERLLSDFGAKTDEISCFHMQFPDGIPAGTMKIFDFQVSSKNPVKDPPVWAKSADAQEFVNLYAKKQVFESKKPQVIIKNGTFYQNGKPEVFVGPFVGNSNRIDWGPRSNPLKIEHIAYTTPPGKTVWDAVGFNSAQISAAWALPGSVLYGLGVPANWRVLEKEFEKYFKNYENTPMVLDFAFGFVGMLNSDNPKKCHELDQQNPDWHSFIPLCPEHPEGDRYYKCFMEGGVKNALKNNCNVIGYELFNESSYNCRCRYNAADFAKRMQKKYGSIKKANQIWETIFDDWNDVASQTNFQQYKKLWPDWCKFSADRYAEILKHYADFIRTIDKRPGIWFTEQSSSTNIYKQRGAGMDYRRIADVLDVLACEGGWGFGKVQKIASTSDMEDVVVAGGNEHFFICDFYRAVGRNVKPVINDEHYCLRQMHGLRVPSRKTDMITALWTEVMHGSSANYTYAWSKRVWEYRTMEQAKKQVERLSYKSSNLLNPFNWPPETLDAFKVFRQELEPYKEKILPLPRTKPATVGLFYSYPTLRMLCYHRIEFANRMFASHTALLNSQYPVQILFEEDLAKPPKEIRSIVVPCAHYAAPGTVEALNDFVKRGGQVIAAKDAFQWDERGNASPVKSKGFSSYDPEKASVEKDLAALLAKNGTPRHAVLEVLAGEKLASSDIQIIDRGNFKLMNIVSFEGLGSRKLRVKLFIEAEDGEFTLNDIVSKRQLLPAKGKTWNARSLKDGFILHLPPQERVVLTLEKKAPKGFLPFTQQEMEKAYSAAAAAEKPVLDKIAHDEKAAREKYHAERLWTDVNRKKCRPVDIRKFVNMDFKDEVSGDKKGGWFDQGSNDFAKMPLGNQIFAGVPFRIINPGANGDKGVMVFYSRHRAFFPKKIENIPVNAKAKRIYFLHTFGWNPRNGEKVLYYRFRYADGSMEEVPIIAGEHICGWWGATCPKQAKIGVESSNLVASKISMQCYRFVNPHPEKIVKSIDIESAVSEGVPAVAAITVEEP